MERMEECEGGERKATVWMEGQCEEGGGGKGIVECEVRGREEGHSVDGGTV